MFIKLNQFNIDPCCSITLSKSFDITISFIAVRKESRRDIESTSDGATTRGGEDGTEETTDGFPSVVHGESRLGNLGSSTLK